MPEYDNCRYPRLKKDGEGKNLCRGCHGAITDPRRRTWCSRECLEKYHPMFVMRAVIKRDKFICQKCGLDIKKAGAEWKEKRVSWFDDKEGYKAHKRLNPKAEYDHIIPFSEGGHTVLENMRTLCRSCHAKVTAEYAAKRAAKRKEERSRMV